MQLFEARWLVVGVIGLGLAYPVLRADPPAVEPKTPRQKAQAAIVKLSENLNAPDVATQAEKIVRENDSCDISSIFKLRERGGLGIGKAVEAGHRDGIEMVVADLAKKKTTTEGQLETYQDDYVRVAKILQAMAELAPYRGEQLVGSSAVKWGVVSATFKEQTAAFRQALEEKDPKKVRSTAVKLRQTCCDCHELRS